MAQGLTQVYEGTHVETSTGIISVLVHKFLIGKLHNFVKISSCSRQFTLIFSHFMKYLQTLVIS